MLVVVEDRDVETFAQLALDDEARRRRDVLEIDASEHWRNVLHGANDLVGVVRREAQRERRDSREVREEQGLPLHHRQRGLRPDVAESEHR